MSYEEIKLAILKEAEKISDECDVISQRLLKFYSSIGKINLNNMTDKEQLDYKKTIKMDANMQKIALLSFMSLFMNKPYDDEIFSIFTEELNEYRNKRKEIEEAIEYFEKQGERPIIVSFSDKPHKKK